MPRTKIDFHKTGEDARAALSALREVGLNPGDVGGAWCAADANPSDVRSPDGHLVSGQIFEIVQIGPVELAGWLADAADDVSKDGRLLTLREIMEGVIADSTEIARIEETLLAKGGIIGVRARDALSPGLS